MHDADDGPEFVSPPFPIIFLTVAKVIVSAIIVLGAFALVAAVFAFAFGVADLYWFD